MKSIGEAQVVCLNCKWEGIVEQTELDIDGEGSLGCPECNNIVTEVYNLLEEILEYRKNDLDTLHSTRIP